MKILKEDLETLWYEDERGNKVGGAGFDKREHKGEKLYQISRFPCELTTNYLRIHMQEAVDKCSHPRKHIKPTGGWVDGIVGRKCTLCGGAQTKKKWSFWPRKWEAYGCTEVVSISRGWSEDLVLAIVKSGDYKLHEAILIAALSCERCVNALAHKYGLDWGYPEYSEEWEKAKTECRFCKGE